MTAFLMGKSMTATLKKRLISVGRVHGARYPQLLANIGWILNRRLKELEQRFTEVATENAERRLALALIRLVGQIGKARPDGVGISLAGEELAQVTGLTLFTISRTVARWDKYGLIRRSRHSIVVQDLLRLQALTVENQTRMTKRSKIARHCEN